MRVSSLHDRLIVIDEPGELDGFFGPSMLSRIITAVGNFSVQYNFQSIAIALIVMSSSVCTTNDDDCKEGLQSGWVLSTATATVFIGAITGQLTMGYAGDVIGRSNAMTLTLSLVSISALCSAILSWGSASAIYAVIIVTRFVLGIGVGGVYPLSATKAAEDGGDPDGKVDVEAASWAFFWQVPGSMAPWFLAFLFSFSDSMSDSTRWRLLLGLGAVPSAVVVVCSVLETRAKRARKRRQGAEGGDIKTALMSSSSGRQGATVSEDAQSIKLPKEDKDLLMLMLREKKTWMNLVATGGGWFIYDVAYYGVNLFGGQIINAINNTDDDNVSAQSSIRNVTEQELIALGTALPACILAIFTLRRIGTKALQVWGFVFIALCFVLMAALFVPLSRGDVRNPSALFFIYCLLLFSLSYGPNLSTFILPAETYPKEVRATFNGVSAAMGKLGAFTGVYMFGPLAEGTSYPTVMVVCAVLSIAGAIVSHFFIDKLEKPPMAESQSIDGAQKEHSIDSEYPMGSPIHQDNKDGNEAVGSA